VRARIVVLNWNGRAWLERCLSAVDRQRTTEIEVVLVDNASTDDSLPLVGARFPWVRVVALAENRGFAGGNNAGAAGCAADYLVFLNNDTEVEPGWLAALMTEADKRPLVGLVTSHITYIEEPGRIDSAGDGYLRCGGAFKIAHGQSSAGAFPSGEVFGACGAAFLIRTKLFEQLGGFDERFFMVYEDVDLSYRARLRGSEIRYAPGAVVRHAGSASLGRISPDAVFFGQRNLEWTWLQNTPAPLLWRSAISHVLYNLAGAFAYARRGLLTAWLRGKLAALAGVPATLARRRDIQRSCTVEADALWRLMEPDWIGVKRREKEFDFRS
jgi:GT2 family glycosyltransferase